MNTVINFFAILLLLSAASCASVRYDAVKLSSRMDESFDQPVKSVYIKIKATLSEKDEEMYDKVIRGFNTSLRQKGVLVKEDFTGDTPDESVENPGVSYKPDAWLVLGKPFEDEWRTPAVTPMGVSYTTNTRKRFIIQLINPATQRDIWTGEVSFLRRNAGIVGPKVVRELERVKLVAPRPTTNSSGGH